MITHRTILKQIDAVVEYGNDDVLFDALTRNGLPLPLPLRLKLSDTQSALLALGLRRLAELTPGVSGREQLCDAIGAVVGRLTAMQRSDGGWGWGRAGAAQAISACRASRASRASETLEATRVAGRAQTRVRGVDPLATATAIAAGVRLEQHPDAAIAGLIEPGLVERGLAALSENQRPDGSWWHQHDRSEADAALTTAFVLYLLTDLGTAVERGTFVEFGKAGSWLSEQLPRLSGQARQLAEMALLDVMPPLQASASRQFSGQIPGQATRDRDASSPSAGGPASRAA